MLYLELLDPDNIQAISRDGLIMALNRKVDLLTRNQGVITPHCVTQLAIH
jgi:hypothetical protein